MRMIILNNGTMIDYMVGEDSCKIVNSHLIKDKQSKYEFIKFLIRKYPQFAVRSVRSYYREWKSHNVLYRHNIEVARTKDTDLCITEYWWRRVGYFFISMFCIDF